ncbi:MAG: MBL fold metallo-hydrolase [Dehalococcoidia bacterium]|nr:MBL fold metallo-hydrolase [Dehalococcoidia bacterium]
MQLTLLGTGSPAPNPLRGGPSEHLQIGPTSMLVDCGSGVVRRMVEANLAPKDIDYIFFTHQHSDHTIDFAHVLIMGWIAGRTKPVTVVGPPGMKEFVQRLLHAFEWDIKMRHLEERVGARVLEVPVREIGHGEEILGEGWKAKAIGVNHGHVSPALGYRFEDGDHTIVLSGDTAPSDALIEAAAGADVIVHELMGALIDRDVHTPGVELTPWQQIVAASHTCVHQVGAVAHRSGVPKLVLNHLPVRPDEEWVYKTIRADYGGEVVLGHDLLRV